MKTLRLIIGILSCVLVLVVLFQSCAATVVTSMGENTDDFSGAAGVVFAIIILSAGITAIAGRNSKGATTAATILYLLAALIGFVSKGVYADLQVWSFLSLGFGIVFAISIFAENANTQKPVHEATIAMERRVESPPKPEKVIESEPVAKESRAVYTATTASPIVGIKPKDPWFVSAIRILGLLEAIVGVFFAVICIKDMPPEKLANIYLSIKETRIFWYCVSGVIGVIWAMTSFIIAGVISDLHAMRTYLAGYSIK